MKPYTYYLRNTKTNQKYYGVRYANTIPASEDFGNVYFTSGILNADFEKNTSDYEWRLFEHDTKQQATEYEQKIVKRIYRRSDWANQGCATGVCMNENIAEKIRNTLSGTKRPHEVYEKIVESKYKMGTHGQPWADSAREKLSKSVSSTGWYHDDVKSYRLKSDDPRTKTLKPGRLKNGWQNKINEGRSMTEAQRKANGERFKSYKWYNDGVKNYRIDPSAKSVEGLTLGRINTTNRKAL